MADELLAVENLNGYYGSAHVLQGVSFEMGDEPVAVIGRNGMGKSTLCAALTGLLDKADGSVRFGGRELMGMPAEILLAADEECRRASASSRRDGGCSRR